MAWATHSFPQSGWPAHRAERSWCQAPNAEGLAESTRNLVHAIFSTGWHQKNLVHIYGPLFPTWPGDALPFYVLPCPLCFHLQHNFHPFLGKGSCRKTSFRVEGNHNLSSHLFNFLRCGEESEGEGGQGRHRGTGSWSWDQSYSLSLLMRAPSIIQSQRDSRSQELGSGTLSSQSDPTLHPHQGMSSELLPRLSLSLSHTKAPRELVFCRQCLKLVISPGPNDAEEQGIGKAGPRTADK